MRRIMLAVAIGLLGLPGCGTDPPTPPPLTPSPSATPSAPTAPELPPEAQGSSRKAAKAFVEYYVAVMSYASRTLDARPLVTASDPGCEACMGIAKSLDKLRKAGGRVKTSDLVILDVSVDSAGPDHTFLVVADVEVPPQTVFASQGADPERFEGIGSDPHQFTVTRRESGWVVTQLRFNG